MIRVFRSVIAAMGGVLVLAAATSAQETEPPAPISVGTRVRVFAPDLRTDRYVGEIRTIDRSAMVLDTAGAHVRLGLETGPVLVDEYRRVTIELAQIQRIEVSGGRTVRTATLRGAILGALGGAVLLGFGNLPEFNPKASDFFRGAPAGLAVGGAVGAAIGWGLGGERWLPARIPR